MKWVVVSGQSARSKGLGMVTITWKSFSLLIIKKKIILEVGREVRSLYDFWWARLIYGTKRLINKELIYNLNL